MCLRIIVLLLLCLSSYRRHRYLNRFVLDSSFCQDFHYLAVVDFHHIDQVVPFIALLLSPCHYAAIAIHPPIRVQVLVLTHERASAEETMPYASYVFAPIPVIGVYGRSYRAEPQCRPEESVYCGWKDVLTHVDEKAYVHVCRNPHTGADSTCVL